MKSPSLGWVWGGLSVIVIVIVIVESFVSCARMGGQLPDGGWYDEDPPKVLQSSPDNGAVNINQKKISILFDEYVKIENANENVIISPPQIEQAEIKTKGKSIVVELKDTLKEHTTYTIDFSDAIVDNNESNPLGNYTFTFSTGEAIDTMQVAGYVLDAETLEPMEGILVGLYETIEPDSIEAIEPIDSIAAIAPVDSLAGMDSIPSVVDLMERHRAFTQLPMLRVSRTDQNGHYSIKGVRNGTYRIYALKDVDNNFMLTPGTGETLAYTEEIVTTSVFDDNRMDTIWLDSLRIKDIIPVPYKHFMPDNVVLRAFAPIRTERNYLKAERKEAEWFSLFFTYGDSIMPELKGINFDATDAFVIEESERRDTITYWLRDTALVNTDSLMMELNCRVTDTLGNLVPYTDTLLIIPKVSYEKRKREEEKKFEEWMKRQNKLKKRGEDYDSIMPREPLNVQYKVDSKLDPDKNPQFIFKTPLQNIDTAAIHLYYEKDSMWYEAKWQLRDKPRTHRTLEILSEWKPGVKYSLEIDTLAFTDIYGSQSKPHKVGIEVKNLDDFGTFRMQMPTMKGRHLICQLLENGDRVAKEVTTDDGDATFYYLAERSYFMRIIVDNNRNGQWDTGDFDKDLQPEEIYYYNKEIKARAKWDLKETWDPLAIPLNQQKPSKLRKSKGSTKRRQMGGKNEQRAKQLEIELPDYLRRK